jgi:hypothetical protein
MIMMIRLFCILYMLTESQFVFSQNLLVNPGAEGSPSGTGWTIVSSGGATCAVGTAASTYTNWVMTPDNSANYPAAHGGTKVFFSGCSASVPGGPFELYQIVDVSADAVQIDAGAVTYIFTGYIQTPVSPQADAGRFIIDYENVTGSVIGTSYVSTYQSFAAGSGSSWNLYSNTRLAPPGTRKIKMRLQATVATGPAVNAYFDDLSILKIVTLPIKLESFTGVLQDDQVDLNWQVSDAVNFSRFDIEKSIDGMLFLPIGTSNYETGKTTYAYTDTLLLTDSYIFYRLKMIDIDSKYIYSSTLAFNHSALKLFDVSPNPASGSIIITGLHARGWITIAGINGSKILQMDVKNTILLIDISLFQKGIYVISYQESGSANSKQLVVR